MSTIQSHKLIVGLGNPDLDLENTYHNAGVLAVEVVAASALPKGEVVMWKRHKDLFEYARLNDKIYVKPLVYMNESGRAVKEAMRIFDVPSTELVVIHDESDLTVGAVKFASGGSTAGHKGIESIISHIKANDFLRVRVGIRDNHEIERKKAGDFVLSPITKSDRVALEGVFETISAKLK